MSIPQSLTHLYGSEGRSRKLGISGKPKKLHKPGRFQELWKLHEFWKLRKLWEAGKPKKLKSLFRLLLVLILGFAILWIAQVNKQPTLIQRTYALSGDEYQHFLLTDTNWPYDNTTPAKFIQLVQGDPNVDQKTMAQIGNIIQNEAANVVYITTKMQYSAPIYLFIDSNKTAYANDLKTHFSASKLTNEVNESLAIQFNNHIYFPVYKFSDDTTNGEIGNTLAHELTHAVLYQNGIETKLPIWINEGFSWYVGNEAEKKIDPRAESLTEKEIQETISYEAKKHRLYTLEQNNTMFTENEPEYNMEWEDYLAVKSLIERYGMDKFQLFLYHLKSESLEVDFQKTFGLPISTYEQNFYQDQM